MANPYPKPADPNDRKGVLDRKDVYYTSLISLESLGFCSVNLCVLTCTARLRKLIKDFGSKGIPSVDDSLWTGLLDLVLLELRVPFKSQLISLKTRNQKFAVTLRAFYRWGQGRGERHNWFVTKYPYHEVKAGFGSDFVSAEMYGHILQWLGQSLTRRLVRDKRRPYTKSVTQIFTVPDVDANLQWSTHRLHGTAFCMWPLRK
ncbi:uncharacterized protein LOC125371770 [Haliotis rufescens]|uniref:uncharacterized protein LOC125371770 n=1 Tax=Haliotis rufescens TaxID=6454 RepID=UPI00201F63D1|nr:uncharacterized protein LOC125371770 [Haliotis rufescens]